MIILVSLNVFLRYTVSSPIVWSEEISLALFTIMTFIGMSSAMKRNSHVGIDYFIRKLPKKISNILLKINYIIVISTLIIVFIYLGFLTAWNSSTSTPVLRINYKWILLSMPIGGVLTFSHFVLGLIKSKRIENEN